MSKVFINPNWHVILIHLPLGVLVLGTLIEVFAFFYRRSPVRVAARWMILLGALAAVPTAFTGIYALDDVVYRSQRPDASHASERPWRDLAWDARLHGGPPPQDTEGMRRDRERTAEGWRMLSRHAWVEGSAALLVVLTAVAILGCSDQLRQRLHVPAMILMVVGVGLMGWGAWYSGETIYRHGTATRLDGSDEPRPAPSAGEGASEKLGRRVEYFAGPPLQTHVLMAGVTVAAALAALGLAVRKMTTATPAADAEGPEAPEVPVVSPPALSHVPAARFCLMAAAAGLLTAALGFWALSRSDEVRTWAPGRLWAEMTDRTDNPNGPVNRRTAHALTGTAVVATLLACAAVARWRWRQKLALAVAASVLVLLVATQVWLGILLLYDGKGVKPGQPFYEFRPAGHAGPAAAIG